MGARTRRVDGAGARRGGRDPRPGRSPGADMVGLTYDTGALIAAEKNERRMWGIHVRALTRGVRPTVPAGVFAEAYRSSRQTNLTRLLVSCVIEPLDGDTARTSGALLGRCSIGVG